VISFTFVSRLAGPRTSKGTPPTTRRCVSDMENKSSSSQTKQPKAYSCVRCFERKVKCDKQHPCAGCLRSKVECVFKIRAAPRRRQRQTPEAIIARLKHCEDLLRDNGIDLNSLSAAARKVDTTSPPPDADYSTTSTSKPTGPDPGSTHHILPLFDPSLYPPSTGLSQGKLIVDHGRARFIEKYMLVFLLQPSC
jgi:hypothetical protein